jgi:hypothetical protein
MRIFNLERNSYCPCGSRRKFKKCCQSRVDEAAHRISQAVGAGGFTAEGLEVIETLGVLCGLQSGEGHPPAPERVGRLLNEAWEEEEQLRRSFDEGALTALSMRVQVLLGEKHQLRTIRIPVWRFGLGGIGEQNDGVVDEIIEFYNSPGGRPFISDAVDSIGMSLLFDDYTDQELKTLLTALGWLVIDDTRDVLLYSVLQKTKSDILTADEEFVKIQKNRDNKDNAELYQELRSLLHRYPIFDQMLSEEMDDDITAVLDAVAKGDLELDVPLYSVLGGLYGMLSKVSDLGEKFLLHQKLTPDNMPPLEETLFAGGEYHCFFPEIVCFLEDAASTCEDKELRDCLESLLFFLVLLSDTKQITVVKYLYVRGIYSYIQRLPFVLPEAELEFGSISDLCDEQLIERYASHLESQEMTEEAAHVREVFKNLGSEAKREISILQDELFKMAKSILDK